MSKKCNQALFAKIFFFFSMWAMWAVCVLGWAVGEPDHCDYKVGHSSLTLDFHSELRFKLNPLRSHALTHLPQQLCRSRSPHPFSHSRYVTRTNFIHFRVSFSHPPSLTLRHLQYPHLFSPLPNPPLTSHSPRHYVRSPPTPVRPPRLPSQ